MSEVSVKTKIAEPLRFLKKAKNVFSSFKELNGRQEKYVDAQYTWGDKSYTRSEIIPDYLLLLNVNKNNSSGRTICISITYKGLNENDAYFIASVSDFEVKKHEFGYSSNNYLKSSNIEQSCKMNYADFSEKLRYFNKQIKNMTEIKDVVEIFANIMGIYEEKNVENKKNLEEILSKKYEDLNVRVENEKIKSRNLSKKIEKKGKKFEDQNGITELKSEEKELMSQLRIIRSKISKKEAEKQESLKPMIDELVLIKNEIENQEKEIENVKREAKNVLGNISFLK